MRLSHIHEDDKSRSTLPAGWIDKNPPTLAEILNNLIARPEIEFEKAEISDNPLDNIRDEYEDDDQWPHNAKVIDLYPTDAGNQLHPDQTFDDGWSLPPGIILGRVELVAARSGVEKWGPTVQMGDERAAMIGDREWVQY